MAAIDVIVFAAAVGFALVIAITIIVIAGIRQEERYLTLTDKIAPSAVAQLARIVLGRYVRREQSRIIERHYDSEGAREHVTCSRR
jgi:hypothetical protein